MQSASHGVHSRCKGAGAQVIGVNNPGTPESALIDMRLLSECNELVVTVGSSYGSIAAGMGGIAPVQMIHGKHQNVQVGLLTTVMGIWHCRQQCELLPYCQLAGCIQVVCAKCAAYKPGLTQKLPNLLRNT